MTAFLSNMFSNPMKPSITGKTTKKTSLKIQAKIMQNHNIYRNKISSEGFCD